MELTVEQTLKGLSEAAEIQLSILERKDQILMLRKRDHKPFLEAVDTWTKVKEHSDALVSLLFAAQSEALSVGNNEGEKEECEHDWEVYEQAENENFTL